MNRASLLIVTLLAAAPLAAQPATDVTPRDSLQVARAQQLFIQGLTRAYLDDHTGALPLYEEALRVAPDQPAVLAALAESHLALDTATSALLYAERAAALAPDEPAYHVVLAGVQMVLERWDAAIATYETLVARYPDQPAYLAELAGLQAATRRNEAAIASYSRLLDRFGDDLRVRGALLRLYDRSGNLPAVARTLESMLQLQPANDLAARLLTEVYLHLNQPREALRVLEAIRTQLPDNAEVTARLADLYHTTGRTGDAAALRRDYPPSSDEHSPSGDQAITGVAETITLLENRLQANPKDAFALQQLGTIKFEAAVYGEAATLLNRAVQQNPRDPDLWASAVRASLYANRPEPAVRLADDALLLFPGQLHLLRLATEASLAAAQARDAVGYAEEALAVLKADEPDNLAAHAELLALIGTAHQQLGDSEKARASLEAAQQTAPRHPPALHQVARALMLQSGERAQALAMIRKAVSLAPDNVVYLHTLGAILFQMKKMEEATEVLSSMVATGKALSATYDLLGDVYLAQGNREDARTAWKRALIDNPGDEALQEKLRRIEQ